ncbi:ABC transporter permease [Marinobacter zhejiangensis]|uniref:Putative ABC transport system permease protein n=1 Tax=Marinobacter zhejiangensis TaxID=488535 RepID=A0A1I4REN2_9GAMM|nr:ABC transporter permease [Marinobacter zhejiangensis]SFM50721.1 putative ABC transport system permease protein [Marinobacter zhejiangensis]
MMTALHTKLYRELWQLRGQVLAIALVIAGGVAVCLMSVVNYSSLTLTRAQYYAENQFADVFATLKRAPRHVAQRIAEIPGVLRVSDRVVGAAKLQVEGFSDPISAQLVSIPQGRQPLLNQLYLRQGRLPDARHSSEVAVVGSFAEAHDLQPGDTIRAIINGRWQALRVVGIVESPEFIFVMPPGSLLPDYQRYGVLWMDRDALAAAMDMEGAFNSVLVQVDREHTVADVIDHLDRVLARYGGTGGLAREDQVSHRYLSDDLEQLRTMATVFPLIFMSVAMFLLNVVIGRLIATQRDVIAVLKAYGYGNWAIARHYLQLAMVIAVLGLVLGSMGGLWLGRGLGEMYMEYYRFPRLLFQVHPGWFILLTLITLSFAFLGSWRAIHQAASLPPAEAMRPEGPARFRITLIERLLSGLRLSQPSRMIVRQLSRRPGRTGLSVVGVALATAIILVGNFQFDSVSLMVHAQFARVQQQDVAVTLTDPVNSAAMFGLVRDPGIRYAEGRRSVPVELIHGHRRWRTVLSGMPEPAHLQFVIDENLEPVSIPEAGVLLTDYLAEGLDIRAGDTLTVQVLEGERRRVEVPVAGTTSELLGVGAYMRLEALNRVLGEGPLVNQILLNIDPAEQDPVYERLRLMPGVLAVNIRETMLDSFYDTLAKTFLTFTFFNSLLGAVIAFGVIYNTVRISLAEKGRELASMRVLGYTSREVGHILLGELVVILMLGIPVGWLLGQGMAAALVLSLQTELYRVPLTMTTQTLALSAAVVLVSAIASGAIAWRRLVRLDLVAVLKTRE